jgi:hypothetical protein
VRARGVPISVFEPAEQGRMAFSQCTLKALADRLNQAVYAKQVTNELTIDYVGLRWQSRKKPAWPVAGRITWDPSRGGYAMAMLKRRWVGSQLETTCFEPLADPRIWRGCC